MRHFEPRGSFQSQNPIVVVSMNSTAYVETVQRVQKKAGILVDSVWALFPLLCGNFFPSTVKGLESKALVHSY